MGKSGICKQCGKHYDNGYTEFCGASCCSTYHNNRRVAEGTCNLLSKNGGSELAAASNRAIAERGEHPFQNHNKSDEFKKLQAEGLSATRKHEAESGDHLWQRPEVRINTEWSKEYSVCERDGIEKLYFYVADCDIDDHFKIGVTRSIDYREWDKRSWVLSNITELAYSDYSKILDLERDLKLKYLDSDRFKTYHSAEVIPNSVREEVIEYVKSRF